MRVPAAALPSMHFFRHTVASRALLAGESVDEVAFLPGHRDATVTWAVYVHEVADARRRAFRRSRMIAEYAGALSVALGEEVSNRRLKTSTATSADRNVLKSPASRADTAIASVVAIVSVEAGRLSATESDNAI